MHLPFSPDVKVIPN